MKLLAYITILFCSGNLQAQTENIITTLPNGTFTLNKTGASYFANLSLQCTENAYPHYYYETLKTAEDLLPPDKLWPSFYGCFDWHSGVHNHWALVKLLKEYPQLPEAKQIKGKLDTSFDAKNILTEVEYFKTHVEADNIYSFEFPYGTSWLLKIADELITWNTPDAKKWLANLQPLITYITKEYMGKWPEIADPYFYGDHFSSALGLMFAIDYARSAHKDSLENMLVKTALNYYNQVQDFPLIKEPFNYDFMSAGLLIADLMRRVLPQDDYVTWLQHFAPDLFKKEGVIKILAVNKLDDHTGFNSHFDGFHLNRIWCLNGIMQSLPDDALDADVKSAWISAQKEMWDYAQQSIGKGNYDEDHWLSSFSVFALIGYTK